MADWIDDGRGRKRSAVSKGSLIGYFRTNRLCRLSPAHEDMKIEALVGGIAVGILSRNVSAWIPACAGMTNEGIRWRTQQPFKRIFVPIAHPGWRRHTKV